MIIKQPFIFCCNKRNTKNYILLIVMLVVVDSVDVIVDVVVTVAFKKVKHKLV